MSQVVIYHNPRCSKSREALKLLEDNKITPKIVLYLDTRLSKTQLTSLLTRLGLKASELIRKNEPQFKELKLGSDATDSACLEAMLKYPKLIERPIIVSGKKAIIGRPPEKVLELL